MLDLPARIDVRQPDGSVTPDLPMWTYWYLQEGEIEFDPKLFVTDDGSESPVLHVDSDQTLRDDAARLITSEPWGVYFKPDRETVQGGAQPLRLGHAIDVDPYPTGTVEPTFPDMWCAALSHCLGRFEGARPTYRQTRSGGAGAFTVDNFPVFDHMRPNVFVAADSNHGYKMIAVGREIARVLAGEHSSLLHPFRFDGSRPAICTRSRTARTPGASGIRRRERWPRSYVRRATITGAVVGAGVPPSGSCVTITALTPLRLPGTPTDAVPLEVTPNSVPVGIGCALPRSTHIS